MAKEKRATVAAGSDDVPGPKVRHRAMWALGDYAKVTRDVLAALGPELVAVCEVARGQRVLDVAAGSGNAAIPAAERGANVVALDLTPELLDAGRRDAAARGVELAWVEGDAEDLPFADGEFDVVMSCIGAMFAPDHQRVADELVRVCAPGGTIGMINWTREGSVGEFFEVFAPYTPPLPRGAQSPLLWGSAEHLQELFGDRIGTLETNAKKLVIERFRDAAEYREYYKKNFGPTIATYRSIADQPETVAALDRDLLAYATRSNRGRPGGPAVFEYDYLLVVARKGTSRRLGRDRP